jgi:hypothetical protein
VRGSREDIASSPALGREWRPAGAVRCVRDLQLSRHQGAIPLTPVLQLPKRPQPQRPYPAASSSTLLIFSFLFYFSLSLSSLGGVQLLRDPRPSISADARVFLSGPV